MILFHTDVNTFHVAHDSSSIAPLHSFSKIPFFLLIVLRHPNSCFHPRPTPPNPRYPPEHIRLRHPSRCHRPNVPRWTTAVNHELVPLLLANTTRITPRQTSTDQIPRTSCTTSAFPTPRSKSELWAAFSILSPPHSPPKRYFRPR